MKMVKEIKKKNKENKENKENKMTHLLTSLHSLSIEPPPEPPPEALQPTRLVLLDIEEFLTARVPHGVVLGVLGAAVDGLGAGGAVQEGGAVGEGDHLGEGVGAFGAADEGGMADLLAQGAGLAAGTGGGEEEGHGVTLSVGRVGGCSLARLSPFAWDEVHGTRGEIGGEVQDVTGLDYLISRAEFGGGPDRGCTEVAEVVHAILPRLEMKHAAGWSYYIPT